MLEVVSEFAPSSKSIFSDTRQARIYRELTTLIRIADEPMLRSFLTNLFYEENIMPTTNRKR